MSPTTRALVLAGVVALPTSAARAQTDPDPWFGHDKALHFAASASIAMVAYGGASLATDDRSIRAVVAGSVALGAGVAKEAWDLAGHGDPSWRDLTWDVVGTATGVLVAYAIDWAVGRLWGRSPAGPVQTTAP
jgi:putative lipoprotein